MTDDAKVSQHVSRKYRELGPEEPPRAIDDVILAAARRSARPWSRRWAAPLSLAAVIVLSVTVTLRIQHEQPGIEVPVPQAAAPPAPAVPAAPAAAPASAARVPQPVATNQAAGAASRSDDTRGAESIVTGERARQIEERTSRDAEAASLTPRLGSFQAQKQAESPERELERIAQLRAQGRHDEADRALAEFRKRYPEFRIPDNMRERVERR